MASGNLLSQGVYSPLPQSLSDSDSEKEMPVRPKFGPTKDGVSGKAKRLVENGLRGVRANGSVDYFIAAPVKSGPGAMSNGTLPPMSLRRKLCFGLSILLCFATAATFLWALPCSESGTCPVHISNWENQHDGIELTGKMNAVQSAFRSTRNLVLFFGGSLNVRESQSGIISVLGSDGSVAWYVIVAQRRPPLDLDCHLLDVNGDEAFDCIVLGTDGSLEAIDSLSGTVLWHAHESNFSFPMVVLQDLDKDGIDELMGIRNGNKFVVISGRSGKIAGETVVTGCGDAHAVGSNSSYVFVSCSGSAESRARLSLSDLVNSALLHQGLPPRAIPFAIERRTNGDVDEDDWFVLKDKSLMVRNYGMCPHSCRAEIVLLETRGERKIASWFYQNSYVFAPVTFAFKETENNLSSLKGHINGFILKMWQWHGYSATGQASGNNKRKPTTSSADNNSNNATKNGTVEVNTIMERIVLITFNATNFHVINASLIEITQLCFAGGKVCQPNLANQNSSLLITDLDADHSQELVSYSSTYVARNGHSEDGWQLVSNMKVIRLEAELPKLYDTAK